jgi:hypothetical protein
MARNGNRPGEGAAHSVSEFSNATDFIRRPPTTQARTTGPRSHAYDPNLEAALVEAIAGAITGSGGVSRPGETIAALTINLAAVLAMTTSAARSPTTLRKTIEGIAKRLRVMAAHTAAEPEARAFLRELGGGAP